VVTLLFTIGAIADAMAPSAAGPAPPGWQVTVAAPMREISALALAPDGALWFLTPRGAFRSDGFEVPQTDDQADAPLYTCEQLHIARSGSLWTWYPEGRLVIRREDSANPDARTELTGRRLRGLVQDARRGDLLLATDRGLHRLPDDARLGRPTLVAGTERLDINSVALSRDGAVLLATNTGVFRMSAEGMVSETGWVPRHQGVEALVADRGGVVWLISAGKLAAASETGTRWYGPKEGLPAAVHMVTTDSKGRLWLASRDAAFVRDRERFRRVDLSAAERPEVYVTALLADREDNVWVGTRAAGLIRIRERLITTLDARTLDDSDLHALATTSDGSVWVSGRRGLTRLRGESRDAIALDTGGAPARLAADARGGLIVATRAGVFQLHEDHPRAITTSPPFPQDEPLAVAVAADEQMWTAWRSGKVLRTSLKNHDTPSAPVPASHDFASPCAGTVTVMTSRRAGGVWLAGSGGISRVDEVGHGACVAPAGALPGARVTSLWEDGRGTLWAGTKPNSGVVRVRNGELQVFTERDGLLCDSVDHLTGDDSGNLWVACPAHLMRVAIRDLDLLSRHPLEGVDALGLGLADGVVLPRADSANPAPGLAVDAMGRLWTLAPSAISWVEPLERPPGRVASPPRLTTISIAGREFPASQVIDASAGSGDVILRFSAVRLAYPERTLFRFMLVGHDARWFVSSQRLTRYRALTPGRYTFKLAASDGFGGWSSPVAATLLLRPPIHARPWFLATMALPVVTLALALRTLRARQARRAQWNIRQERQRIARELHDGVAQGFATLAFHLDVIDRQLPADAEEARKTARESRELLGAWHSQTRQTIWSLRMSDEAAPPFGRAVRQAVEKALQVTRGHPSPKIHIATGDTAVDVSALAAHEAPFIVQEAVTNAIRHGKARTIEVAMQVFDDEVLVRVEDDGIGMTTDHDAATMVHQGHFGLIGMHERARRFEGRVVIDSDGCGTRILIAIPANDNQREAT
jgi:signal transduction histidine kinase/ligand-binding sensor domain-containing protein